MAVSIKQRIYRLLEAGYPNDRASLAVDWCLITLIVANVTAAALETMPALAQKWVLEFLIFDIFSVLIFTVEYIARLWVCTEHPPLSQYPATKVRLQFARRPLMVIDLVAILPTYISLLFPVLDLRLLRIFRLLRLLKLARYSPALSTLWQVVLDERRALGAALLIMSGLIMVAATGIYYAERAAQPESFGSIPEAMWWALATLTTVGYGDIVPITPVGRIVGSIVMIFGLGMFALPIGIIASGFASEIHRRDFVVNWGMLARIPIFSELDSDALLKMAPLVRARAVPSDSIILRRGVVPDSLFFIASGEVEVEWDPEPLRLSEGEYFGAHALLAGAPQAASVRSTTECRLMTLDAEDFRDLIASERSFREAFERDETESLSG